MFNEVSMGSWMDEGWCSLLSLKGRDRGMHSLPHLFPPSLSVHSCNIQAANESLKKV